MLLPNSATKSTTEDLIPFLKKRKNLLDAVVLSGGEATLYPDIFQLCKTIKELGYKIKLDTNGANPDIIKQLIPFLDYISLDVKAASKEKMKQVTHTNHYDQLIQSLDILAKSNIDYECRTTVHSKLFTQADILDCINLAHQHGYSNAYGVQLSMKDVPMLKKMSNTKEFNTKLIQEQSPLTVNFRNFTGETDV
jgi:pyruvate formate lyase activating enzyme